jgi:hypothetical protein
MGAEDSDLTVPGRELHAAELGSHFELDTVL